MKKLLIILLIIQFSIINNQLSAQCNTPAQHSICLITVDTTSTKNVIVWEKPFIAGIDSFRIYRDINYKHIGSVANSELSVFIDSTFGINPNITSYPYAISILDSCGIEGPMSIIHKTIHLQISLGNPPAINLSWDDYIGFNFNYYRILRDSTGLGNWEVVDSVGSGILSWTEANPPQTPGLRYLVEVVPPDVCTATKKGENYNSSKSNITLATLSSINEISNNINYLTIHPNPNRGKFTLEMETPKPLNLQLNIFNILGQEIFSENLTNTRGIFIKKINLTDQQTGIYNLQILNNSNIINRKIIIQ